jgi:chitinase
MVVVTNRGVQAAATVAVQVPDPLTSPLTPINHIPVPDTGPDRIVAPEQVILLSAAGSHDPDGDALEYRWEQQSGEAIVLRDDDTVEASFISPHVDSDEVLEFTLVVIDPKGATSFPATVRITVRPQ